MGSQSPQPGEETEPNDTVASADPIAPGTPMTGAIGWARDVDVYCVSPFMKTGPIRWKVRDARRDAGSVLQATSIVGSAEGVPVRIHLPSPAPAHAGAPSPAEPKPSATDVMSPWRSAPVEQVGDTARCLKLRLTNDPWTGAASAGTVMAGGSEPYVVEVEAGAGP
jgi:hypothetical protein